LSVGAGIPPLRIGERDAQVKLAASSPFSTTNRCRWGTRHGWGRRQSRRGYDPRGGFAVRTFQQSKNAILCPASHANGTARRTFSFILACPPPGASANTDLAPTSSPSGLFLSKPRYGGNGHGRTALGPPIPLWVPEGLRFDIPRRCRPRKRPGATRRSRRRGPRSL
jgi:hypothetical protein